MNSNNVVNISVALSSRPLLNVHCFLTLYLYSFHPSICGSHQINSGAYCKKHYQATTNSQTTTGGLIKIIFQYTLILFLLLCIVSPSIQLAFCYHLVSSVFINLPSMMSRLKSTRETKSSEKELFMFIDNQKRISKLLLSLCRSRLFFLRHSLSLSCDMRLDI